MGTDKKLPEILEDSVRIVYKEFKFRDLIRNPEEGLSLLEKEIDRCNGLLQIYCLPILENQTPHIEIHEHLNTYLDLYSKLKTYIEITK